MAAVDFCFRKIHPLWPGSNPQPWVQKASDVLTTPPRRLNESYQIMRVLWNSQVIWNAEVLALFSAESSSVNLKFFVNAAKKKKHHSSLCFSGDPNFTSERVIQSSSLGAERAGNRGILDESTFREGGGVQTHKLHREISKEVSSQGLGDLFTATSYVKSKSVLLATAICFIRDSFGKMQEREVRALLDGGSTSNFISQQCMNRLNLKREKINILVSGLNNSGLTIKSRVNATIANRGNSYETNADFFVVPRITDVIPSQPFNVSLGNFSREKLADENFNIPGNIDLLLGAEIFYEILLPGQTNLLNTKLIFQNTVFGYIASGSIPVSSENKPHCGLIKDNVDLEKTMRRFWEIENVEPETMKNKETIISHSVEREHGREPIKTFELSTVTYGTTSAPFLATRTLKQLALDEAGNFPLGSSVVMSDMYIDDVLTGAETLLEAKRTEKSTDQYLR
ncbi:integrase catalytic domain-containing protein [Trichonephila clavipes]|nr:integrase catalytic domain-containing protein [Trichonephila clavipes]